LKSISFYLPSAESTTAKQSQLQEEPDLITFDTEEHEKKETHQSDQHSGEAQPQPLVLHLFFL
jgi:hypothetical protein